MSETQQIKERLSLAAVVSERVQLQPLGGGNYKGLCPFHNEKTPSFTVDDSKGVYHCFGCKAGGDVFTFVQETEGTSFRETLEMLAARAGVELERREASQPKADAAAANEFAARYYQSCLTDERRAYLASRGLATEDIQKWEIGYAPHDWAALLSAARQTGLDDAALLNAGLVRPNSRGGLYDAFRGRLMFPIRDRLGRVLGFSGRDMVGGKAKYINTSETDLFHKSEVLYGLPFAAKARPSEIIVVEGQIDVIMMHKHGFTGAVAPLGSALTVRHAEALLKLKPERLTLLFDGDEAGVKATLKGLNEAAALIATRAAALPKGLDPADALLSHGPAIISAALERATDEAAYRVGAAVDKHGKADALQRRAVMLELLPRLKGRDLFDPVAERVLRLAAAALGMSETDLKNWVTEQGGPRFATPAVSVQASPKPQAPPAPAVAERLPWLEREMIKCICAEPELCGYLQAGRYDATALNALADLGDEATLEDVKRIAGQVAAVEDGGDVRRMFVDALNAHTTARLEREARAIVARLAGASAEEQATLLEELIEIKQMM